MNFQAYLEDTYRIIKKEPLILVGGGFLLQLIVIATQGLAVIFAGPLLGGYILLVVRYFRDNRRPAFNDLFLGFKRFGSLFPYVLVLLIIVVGFAFLVIPGLILATWWIYVLPLMVDRNMSFSDAMGLSMKTVNEKGFFMHLIFLFLISLVPIMLINILTLALPVLVILGVLLPPFETGCLVCLYLDQFGPAIPGAPAPDAPLTEKKPDPSAKNGNGTILPPGQD